MTLRRIVELISEASRTTQGETITIEAGSNVHQAMVGLAEALRVFVNKVSVARNRTLSIHEVLAEALEAAE